MARNKQGIKAFFKIVATILSLLLAIVIIYVAYVFLSYSRIDDNQKLKVNSPKAQSEDFDSKPISTDKTYTIGTYNVGFGAYLPDYSFYGWRKVLQMLQW